MQHTCSNELLTCAPIPCSMAILNQLIKLQDWHKAHSKKCTSACFLHVHHVPTEHNKQKKQSWNRVQLLLIQEKTWYKHKNMQDKKQNVSNTCKTVTQKYTQSVL